MNTIEVSALIFSFIATIFSIKQKIYTWPVGILACILYACLFYQVKLYADMGLQIVIISLFVYGWYQWLYGGADHGELNVSRTTLSINIKLIVIFLLISSLLIYFLQNYTDSEFVYCDASLAVLVLIAQWMLARKILENWLLWFVCDAIYTVLYWYKHLFFTSILYFIYALLALYAYTLWKKNLAKQGKLVTV